MSQIAREVVESVRKKKTGGGKIYKIRLGLGDFQSSLLEVEAENWEGVVDYVFGHLDILEWEVIK